MIQIILFLKSLFNLHLNKIKKKLFWDQNKRLSDYFLILKTHGGIFSSAL